MTSLFQVKKHLKGIFTDYFIDSYPLSVKIRVKLLKSFVKLAGKIKFDSKRRHLTLCSFSLRCMSIQQAIENKIEN